MNGHASSDSSESYAPLTSGLLARKGQAQPAFDSDAYAEVMIGDGFAAPISPIFSKPGAYAPNPGAHEPGSPHAESDASESPAPRRRQSQSSARPRAAPRSPARPAPAFRAARDGPIHAMVTFRLAREEFARLRRAAKELDMTCHRIILDAIECYLDANEVEPIKNEQWVGEPAEADENE